MQLSLIPTTGAANKCIASVLFFFVGHVVTCVYSALFSSLRVSCAAEPPGDLFDMDGQKRNAHCYMCTAAVRPIVSCSRQVIGEPGDLSAANEEMGYGVIRVDDWMLSSMSLDDSTSLGSVYYWYLLFH